jgi:hypothetical protein
LSNVTELALEEFHVSVVVDPAFTIAGVTTTLIAGRAITVTLAEAIAVPPGPVAVAV